MSTTVIADHLESVLLELEYASQDIASCSANLQAPSSEVERSLLQALETARLVLENALSHAQQNGVPKLAIDAA